MPNTANVSEHDLSAFITRCFYACGMPAADAKQVGALMARADVMGQDGHGVFRLPMYIKRVRAGGMNMTPDFKVIEDRAATALIDGDNGIGHLVMRHATELAMEKARKTGVAWVGARHSNHAGPASLYPMMAAQDDMIGIYMAVASANHMPPWGGVETLLGTNPIAVAVPSKDFPPIVLDMATTVAAYGKVKTARQRKEQMPEGWMVDRNGAPLTDPDKSDDGFLLPIGGPKGYGLSLIFGILAGVLNGANFGRDVVDFNADAVTTTNTGHMILALDIKAFADPETFKTDIDAVWRELKSSALMADVSEIRLPGERMHSVTQTRQKDGIPLPDALRANLETLAAELGVDRL
ncbi:MAG: Ldh family oxidoreductase [Octadecabacter sp.]